MLHTILSFFQCRHCEVSLLSPPNSPPDDEVHKYNDDPAHNSANNPFLLEELDPRGCETVFVQGPCTHQLCRITDPEWIAEQYAAEPICEKDHDDMYDLGDRCQGLTAEAIHTAQLAGVPNVKASLDWAMATVLCLGDARIGLKRMLSMITHGEARFVWEGTKVMVGKCLDAAEDYLKDQERNMERNGKVSEDLAIIDVDEDMQSEDAEMSTSGSSSPCRCPPETSIEATKPPQMIFSRLIDGVYVPIGEPLEQATETPIAASKPPQMIFSRKINGVYVPIGEPLEQSTESAAEDEVDEQATESVHEDDVDEQATDSETEDKVDEPSAAPLSPTSRPPKPICIDFTTPTWLPRTRALSELSPGSPRSNAPVPAPPLEAPILSPITRTLQEVEDELNAERKAYATVPQPQIVTQGSLPRKRKLSQLSPTTRTLQEVEYSLNKSRRLHTTMQGRKRVQPFPAPFLEPAVRAPVMRTLGGPTSTLHEVDDERNLHTKVRKWQKQMQVSQASETTADMVPDSAEPSLFARNAVDLGAGRQLPRSVRGI